MLPNHEPHMELSGSRHISKQLQRPWTISCGFISFASWTAGYCCAVFVIVRVFVAHSLNRKKRANDFTWVRVNDLWTLKKGHAESRSGCISPNGSVTVPAIAALSSIGETRSDGGMVVMTIWTCSRYNSNLMDQIRLKYLRNGHLWILEYWNVCVCVCVCVCVHMLNDKSFVVAQNLTQQLVDECLFTMN